MERYDWLDIYITMYQFQIWLILGQWIDSRMAILAPIAILAARYGFFGGFASLARSICNLKRASSKASSTVLQPG